MIKSFAHKGLERFYRSGSKAGIRAEHGPRLRRQLSQLDISDCPGDMDVYGWRLHALKGELAGHWAVSVSGNWRMTFRFNGHNAEVVDYQDYH
jgi:toxin HigB-1